MHYKNGRPAQEGDPVLFRGQWTQKVSVGVLHSATPNSTTCNAQVAVMTPDGKDDVCVTVSELYHAEDAWQALQPSQPAVAERNGEDSSSPADEAAENQGQTAQAAD